jgi:MFS family permease
VVGAAGVEPVTAAQHAVGGGEAPPSVLAALRVRNFRVYLSGLFVAVTGLWMLRLAQTWLVLQLTGSGVALGILTALMYLPLVLVGSWAGVLADRYDKRRLLIVCQAVMGLSGLALGVLVIGGWVRVWHVFTLAFVSGVASSIDQPARMSFVIEMVGPRVLPNAVALNSAMFNAARLVGPAAGGLLAGIVGTGWVALTYTLSVGAVLTALFMLRQDELHPVPKLVRGRAQFREGLRYVRNSTELSTVFVVVALVGSFGFTLETTLPLMTSHVFGGGATQIGLLNSTMAAGSLFGAVLATRRGKPGWSLLLGAGTCFGIFAVAAAWMPSIWLYGLCLIPMGVANLTYITASNSMTQLSVEPVMRGRVMALYLTTMLGGAPVGSPIVGAVAQAISPRAAASLGGVITLLAVGLGCIHLVRRRRVDATAQAFVVESASG